MKVYRKICENCGREYETGYNMQKFCGKECAGEGKEFKDRDKVESRPFTPDTANLIKLWSDEGCSVRTIASILKRPVAVILDVLAGNEDKYEVKPFFPEEQKVVEGRRYSSGKVEVI